MHRKNKLRNAGTSRLIVALTMFLGASLSWAQSDDGPIDPIPMQFNSGEQIQSPVEISPYDGRAVTVLWDDAWVSTIPQETSATTISSTEFKNPLIQVSERLSAITGKVEGLAKQVEGLTSSSDEAGAAEAMAKLSATMEQQKLLVDQILKAQQATKETLKTANAAMANFSASMDRQQAVMSKIETAQADLADSGNEENPGNSESMASFAKSMEEHRKLLGRIEENQRAAAEDDGQKELLTKVVQSLKEHREVLDNLQGLQKEQATVKDAREDRELLMSLSESLTEQKTMLQEMKASQQEQPANGHDSESGKFEMLAGKMAEQQEMLTVISALVSENKASNAGYSTSTLNVEARSGLNAQAANLDSDGEPNEGEHASAGAAKAHKNDVNADNSHGQTVEGHEHGKGHDGDKDGHHDGHAGDEQDHDSDGHNKEGHEHGESKSSEGEETGETEGQSTGNVEKKDGETLRQLYERIRKKAKKLNDK